MSEIVKEAESFVLKLLNESLDSKYVYHNLPHTQRVVQKVQEMTEDAELTEVEKENLLLAAWFHDTGFVKKAEGHEAESTKIAGKFFEDKGLEKDRIDSINEIILATQMEEEPHGELQNIIRDADCAHLGSKSFLDYSELLKREIELTQDKKIKDADWLDTNLDFLSNQHKYYSEYALKNWSQTKSKNISRLLKIKKQRLEDSKKFKQKKEAIDLKKKKGEVPERGVETMFRVALRNHITLSDIADTKANILLSVNAIIISMTFSTLIPKLDNPSNTYLVIPSVIFIFFTVICMILSILATRPNVTQGKFTKEDVANKKVNLLFFGNFHKMKLNDFEWGITEMMQDRDYLYGSLTKDLYFLGLVLNRKYGLLRVTYNVFMIGIIVSVIAFTVAFIMQSS
ncbi:MAG: phosphohydrolase [Flavobacteriaceae bacterium]|nr:phosphohydrolase [Flavobacteriaceae bacterium]|tara:strand:- start:45901 stop:47097 length:1197 start_codon:yes stop_codon:yes gene_type:complete